MKKLHAFNLVIGIALLLTLSCQQKTDQNTGVENSDVIHADDPHSFSNINEVRVSHIHLDLSTDFEQRTLKGFAELSLNRLSKASELVLDSRKLKIERVLLNGKEECTFQLDEDVPYFGQALHIPIKESTRSIRIYYETSPESDALQWLSPEQTNDKKHPFLFSQSQAILARTWVPCQDAPGVKFTYSATIRTQAELMALMSAAGNANSKNADGVYHFEMNQPISSYLLALAVGDLAYKQTGRNSGVYAEPGFIEACAWELADMQSMIDSAEALYGPYQWDQYDVLVLPPSFPFGGMENPRLTFATPTIIAGDRSLVALIAHELAHSWSGNLVTNETWNDFWLNEGFTVYFEQRIMEKIYGKNYEDMLTVLGMGDLKHTIADLTEEGQEDDTRLYLNLEGRDPDDGLTDVAYEKGRFFLQTAEAAAGREKFDAFLMKYFSENAFKPMSTERFLAYFNEHLVAGDSSLAAAIRAKDWIYGQGLPLNCPQPVSSELKRVEFAAANYNEGQLNASEIDTTAWTTHHWLYFLRQLDPKHVDQEKISELDQTFNLTAIGNSEIACDWFKHCIRTRYTKAYPALETFLGRVGRRKFLSPLYAALLQNEEDQQKAREIFEKSKGVYHSVSSVSIEEMLQKAGV